MMVAVVVPTLLSAVLLSPAAGTTPERPGAPASSVSGHQVTAATRSVATHDAVHHKPKPQAAKVPKPKPHDAKGHGPKPGGKAKTKHQHAKPRHPRHQPHPAPQPPPGPVTTPNHPRPAPGAGRAPGSVRSLVLVRSVSQSVAASSDPTTVSQDPPRTTTPATRSRRASAPVVTLAPERVAADAQLRAPLWQEPPTSVLPYLLAMLAVLLVGSGVWYMHVRGIRWRLPEE